MSYHDYTQRANYKCDNERRMYHDDKEWNAAQESSRAYEQSPQSESNRHYPHSQHEIRHPLQEKLGNEDTPDHRLRAEAWAVGKGSHLPYAMGHLHCRPQNEERWKLSGSETVYTASNRPNHEGSRFHEPNFLNGVTSYTDWADLGPSPGMPSIGAHRSGATPDVHRGFWEPIRIATDHVDSTHFQKSRQGLEPPMASLAASWDNPFPAFPRRRNQLVDGDEEELNAKTINYCYDAKTLSNDRKEQKADHGPTGQDSSYTPRNNGTPRAMQLREIGLRNPVADFGASYMKADNLTPPPVRTATSSVVHPLHSERHSGSLHHSEPQQFRAHLDGPVGVCEKGQTGLFLSHDSRLPSTHGIPRVIPATMENIRKTKSDSQSSWQKLGQISTSEPGHRGEKACTTADNIRSKAGEHNEVQRGKHYDLGNFPKVHKDGYPMTINSLSVTKCQPGAPGPRSGSIRQPFGQSHRSAPAARFGVSAERERAFDSTILPWTDTAGTVFELPGDTPKSNHQNQVSSTKGMPDAAPNASHTSLSHPTTYSPEKAQLTSGHGTGQAKLVASAPGQLQDRHNPSTVRPVLSQSYATDLSRTVHDRPLPSGPRSGQATLVPSAYEAGSSRRFHSGAPEGGFQMLQGSETPPSRDGACNIKDMYLQNQNQRHPTALPPGRDMDRERIEGSVSNGSGESEAKAVTSQQPAVRVGVPLIENNQQAKPLPLAQYSSGYNVTQKQQQRKTSSRSLAHPEMRLPGPVTHEQLEKLRHVVKANPLDMKTELLLAMRLVEAASVLVEKGGRADSKTQNRQRERYILDAHKVIKKLIGQGYAEAMFYLADCYGQGSLGLEVDPKEAFRLYQYAAKAGHAESAYRTAVCCEMGPEEGGGTRKDPLKAVQWYKRAASLGNPPAMYKMGMILLKGLLGQQKNTSEGVIWLKRAAERADRQNPHSLHELGLLYECATANDKIIRDDAYALQLFMQAATLNYKFSQFRLGQIYEYGQLGCTIDARTSIAWYSRAAAQGEHQAELALSGWYLTGSEGVLRQSDDESYLWARKAACAEPPLAKAMFAMGYYTEIGIGCPRSLEEAKRWYGRAALATAHKFAKAQERLEELKQGGPKVQKQCERLSRTNNKPHEAECKIM